MVPWIDQTKKRWPMHSPADNQPNPHSENNRKNVVDPAEIG
jgi:hypothetical protein